jgi:hypothetical protein
MNDGSDDRLCQWDINREGEISACGEPAVERGEWIVPGGRQPVIVRGGLCAEHFRLLQQPGTENRDGPRDL